MPSLYYREPERATREEFYVVEEEPSRRRRKRRSRRYRKKRTHSHADYLVGQNRSIDHFISDDGHREVEYYEVFEPVEIERSSRADYIKDRFVVEEPVYYIQDDAGYINGNQKAYHRRSHRRNGRREQVYIVEDGRPQFDQYFVRGEQGRGRLPYLLDSKSFIENVVDIDQRNWNLPIPPETGFQHETNSGTTMREGERILSIIAQPPVKRVEKQNAVEHTVNGETMHAYSRGSRKLDELEYNGYGESNEETASMAEGRIISVIGQPPVKKYYEKWSFVGDAPDVTRTHKYSRGSVENKERINDQMNYSTRESYSQFENDDFTQNDEMVKSFTKEYVTTKEIHNVDQVLNNKGETHQEIYVPEYAVVNKSRKVIKKGRDAEVYDMIDFNKRGDQNGVEFNEYSNEVSETLQRFSQDNGRNTTNITSSNSQRCTAGPGNKKGKMKKAVLESPLHCHEIQETGMSNTVLEHDVKETKDGSKQQQRKPKYNSPIEKEMAEWMHKHRTTKRASIAASGIDQAIPTQAVTVEGGRGTGLTPPMRTYTDLVEPEYEPQLSGLKSNHNTEYNAHRNYSGIDQTDGGGGESKKKQQEPTFLEWLKEKLTPSSSSQKGEVSRDENGERPFGQGKYIGNEFY